MEIKKAGIKPFLFENIGTKQTIFKNIFWLGVSEGLYRLLGAILIVYMARILGAVEFGKFSFAVAFVSLFVVFSDFGLSDITTRELSRNKEVEKEYPAILSLKIILSIAALFLILFFSFFVTTDHIVLFVIWILALYILLNDFFFIIYSFLRARQQMEYEAGFKILQALIIFGVVFFVLFKFPSVGNVSLGYLFANLVALILVLLFLHSRIQPLRLIFTKNIRQKFLRLSWPLGLTAICGGVFLNINLVTMGYFGQIVQTGWYNAAYRIIVAITIPAALIGTSIYPVLSKTFHEAREKFQQVLNFQIELMIILAAPLVTGGLLLAPYIINFLYGASFSPSILTFQILLITVGINFLYSPFYLSLIASGQQKKTLWVTLTGAVVNIILNLILIPRYSLYGAAISMVITFFAIFFLAVEFSKRFTSISFFSPRLLRIILISVFASMIMLLAINQLLVYNNNIFLNILVGILSYSGVLFFAHKLLTKFHLLPKII